ncbi:MAG: carbohydrate kinase family protein [Longimicrobiales bacterium]|nr:carbohydrate kinase family protein [Longimicrobiales bacterium]
MSDSAAGRRRLGVVGTLVWDTILRRDAREAPVEEWGGIAYALAALDATLPPEWEIVPLLRIGSDLAEPALRFLRESDRFDLDTGIRVVDEPNNRVELHYSAEGRRTERLSGGVSPWSWPDLAPAAHTCDALYVNFISGFEIDLDAARALRAGFTGPTYADLHSLFLGIGRAGVRVPRELPAWGGWLRAFDAVQMNEAEFDLLGRAWGDPWQLAAEVVGPELKLILVTLEERGAAWVCSPDFIPDPGSWPASRHAVGRSGTVHSGRVPLTGGRVEGDATGCGDVWGATLFSRLLAGDDLEAAMRAANQHAARNVTHRGARGLTHHLLGRIATDSGDR